jgi:hypothetical protein
VPLRFSSLLRVDGAPVLSVVTLVVICDPFL